MKRHEVLDLMRELKLVGMRAAYDQVLSDAPKRQHPAAQIVGSLLQAEIAEKQARRARCQIPAAKLPLIEELVELEFSGTTIHEGLVREMATGSFLDGQRNAVLVGGTGKGKTHLSVASALSCIRLGCRVQFCIVIDLVNRLVTEARTGKTGRLAEQLTLLDLVVLDKLGYLPFAQRGGAAAVPSDQPPLRADLDPGHHQPNVCRMADGVQRRQDDHGTARPAHPPLRHHRNRQRQLAIQEPKLDAPGCPIGQPGGLTFGRRLRVRSERR